MIIIKDSQKMKRYEATIAMILDCGNLHEFRHFGTLTVFVYEKNRSDISERSSLGDP